MNQYDDSLDESVDNTDAEPVDGSPDSEQAADPVENVGEVVGRRNPDLPTETPRAKSH